MMYSCTSKPREFSETGVHVLKHNHDEECYTILLQPELGEADYNCVPTSLVPSWLLARR